MLFAGMMPVNICLGMGLALIRDRGGLATEVTALEDEDSAMMIWPVDEEGKRAARGMGVAIRMWLVVVGVLMSQKS